MTPFSSYTPTYVAPSPAAARSSRLATPPGGHWRGTFQLKATCARHPETKPEAVMLQALQQILDWVEHHPLARVARRPLMPEARQGAPFTLEVSGLRAEAIARPEEGVWALRVTHIDVSTKGGVRVPGRMWIKEVALRTVDGETRLGVKTECADREPTAMEAPRERPIFIRDLSRDPGLLDVRPLVPLPWILRDETDQDTFLKFLSDPQRTLPVVLLTEVDFGQTPIGTDRFLLPAEDLAQRLLGLAHVVAMPKHLTFRWSDTLGKVWSAHSGAVRTYWPGIDFERDDPRDHPLILANRVLFYSYEDLRAEAAYMAWLVDNILRVNARIELPWEGLVFPSDITKEPAKPEDPAQAEENRDWRAVYDEEIASLERRAANLERELARAEQAVTEAREANEDVARENLRLQVIVDGLRDALWSKAEVDPDDQIPMPASFEELGQWAQDHLAGRLELHPRALRALKNARFEDMELVAQSLLLLASAYRDARLGMPGAMNDFEDGAADLHLDLSGSITRERAGEEGDTYFVEYPPGSGKREFLELHLRHGNSRDERQCLAIYFFWHDQRQRVVVGWLPSHLDNRLT